MELNSTVSASELRAFSAISLHIELLSQFISQAKLTRLRKEKKKPCDALRKRGNAYVKCVCWNLPFKESFDISNPSAQWSLTNVSSFFTPTIAGQLHKQQCCNLSPLGFCKTTNPIAPVSSNFPGCPIRSGISKVLLNVIIFKGAAPPWPSMENLSVIFQCLPNSGTS